MSIERDTLALRLRASVGHGAINGDSAERLICGKQMKEAADELDRIGAELKAEKHEVEEWKRCVSDEQVMQRAAEISRLRNAAVEMLKAWDTRRPSGYRTDVNDAMDNLRNAAGIVAPFDPTDPPPGPFDVTYRDGLGLPDENLG